MPTITSGNITLIDLTDTKKIDLHIASNYPTVQIYDTNNDKISKLINHEIPFYENGLKQAILKNRNRLHFSTDERTVLENSDIIFLCVNTPEKTNGSSNLHYFNNAVKSLIKNFAIIGTFLFS